MPRMRNPFTQEIADVIDARAEVLAERGWEEVIEGTPEPTVVVVGAEEAEAKVQQARDVADWLIAEAQHERDQAAEERDARPTTDEHEAVKSQLEQATTDLGARPTADDFEQVEAELETVRVQLEEALTAPPADGSTPAPAPEAAAKPAKAPARPSTRK